MFEENKTELLLRFPAMIATTTCFLGIYEEMYSRGKCTLWRVSQQKGKTSIKLPRNALSISFFKGTVACEMFSKCDSGERPRSKDVLEMVNFYFCNTPLICYDFFKRGVHQTIEQVSSWTTVWVLLTVCDTGWFEVFDRFGG